MENRRTLGAIVHPAGKTKATAAERLDRIEKLKELGFDLTDLCPEVPESFHLTAGKPIERSILLSHALTHRKYSLIWAARGGFGTTELVAYLKNQLPPVLPPKTFVGFSDNSFLGNFLASRYPNFTFIHANHVFDPSLLNEKNEDSSILFKLLSGEDVPPIEQDHLEFFSRNTKHISLAGPCIPFNLSLAESFAAMDPDVIPEGTILFLEEVNEELYRVVRKFDSLLNSGFLNKCAAIVIGNFTQCIKPDGSAASESEIALLFSRKVDIPVIVWPVFGHDSSRLPLIAHSTCRIEFADSFAKLNLSMTKADRPGLSVRWSQRAEGQANIGSNKQLKLHFTGVGGTGMAAVAGLFKSAGFQVTGSDNPIYPPMDEVLKFIGLQPIVGYHTETLKEVKPDAVVLANVITRRNAELKPNHEMESLLELDIPTFSFPSAMRGFFLTRTKNIVVTGTHGKTSTTSLIAQMLTHLGKDPSLFVGGSPLNFHHGFKQGTSEIFVLEGDEYDSALFDKGPKFLHYEPSIALINNIEFDHADIYQNVEAIEEEFYRLACLTRDRGGIVVANMDDDRVVRVVKRSMAETIWFGRGSGSIENPHWQLVNFSTLTEGSVINCLTPDKQNFSFKTRLFGLHNAMNSIAAMAVMHALGNQEQRRNEASKREAIHPPSQHACGLWGQAAETFLGVKRRFEMIGNIRDISIFDDFAHHPTAIATTLEAFKFYVTSSKRTGRLIACFDPRNATMRRSILQEQLAKSFTDADMVFLGKVPADLRLKANESLDGQKVADLIGEKATYFSDNDQLLAKLSECAKAGDTVVFMSSGSFDGLPRKLQKKLESI
jgi:UDP-N-acetylmuramate: L-alanyl-gamma-D-glutamyl-meso-diaminopimelate ligase